MSIPFILVNNNYKKPTESLHPGTEQPHIYNLHKIILSSLPYPITHYYYNGKRRLHRNIAINNFDRLKL